VRRTYLFIEFLVLFVGVPMLFVGAVLPLRWLMAGLWFLAACCLIYLLLDPTFDKGRFLRLRGIAQELPVMMALFVTLTLALGGLIYFMQPEALFSFVKARPQAWVVIMLLYPILSVYPQTIVYRGFLFHRYRPILTSAKLRIMVGATAFAFVHVVFQNEVAPMLTLLGGVLFARTYERSGSMLLSAFEHSLYGCMVMTLGWGMYLYHGAVR
jgi:hypothetical protein